MSIVHCNYCNQYIDTDFDAEHFIDGLDICTAEEEDNGADEDQWKLEEEMNRNYFKDIGA